MDDEEKKELQSGDEFFSGRNLSNDSLSGLKVKLKR